MNETVAGYGQGGHPLPSAVPEPCISPFDCSFGFAQAKAQSSFLPHTALQSTGLTYSNEFLAFL